MDINKTSYFHTNIILKNTTQHKTSKLDNNSFLKKGLLSFYVKTMSTVNVKNYRLVRQTCHWTWFSILKTELIYNLNIAQMTFNKLENEINNFIDYYNDIRKQEKLNWMSLSEYKIQV